MLSSNTSAVSGDTTYIEDVFSTYLYTGNGTVQTINNGVALGSAYGGSVYFDGTGDYLRTASTSAAAFGTGDFTMEAWVNPTSTPATYRGILSTYDGASGVIIEIVNGTWMFWVGAHTSSAITASLGVWTHVALTRSGSTVRFFVNGALTNTISNSTNYGSSSITVGSMDNTNGFDFNGYISNARIVNGTAVYTSAFTPGTAPLTAITNTSFLTCQSPSPTTDYSTNALSITVTNAIAQNGGGPFTDSTANKGGLVWIKSRSALTDNSLYDTARGVTNEIQTNKTIAQASTSGLTAFNTNGFSMGLGYNASSTTYTSWTFRKQPKFFDVVTYTGTGSARTVAHNLGAVPGCMIIKRTDSTGNWGVYHRSVANTDFLLLNDTAATQTSSSYWNNTTPTSTQFSVGANVAVNASGGTYVAYLFAHDAGGFGLTGTDNVISCGSYTGTGSGSVSVTLGYEPQYLLIKQATGATLKNWWVIDNMRGMPVGGNEALLAANLSDAEVSADLVSPTATGFEATNTSQSNLSGVTYIYIAIRRGPMKVPTDATTVFAPVTANVSSAITVTTGFPVDLSMFCQRTHTELSGNYFLDRLRGSGQYISSTNTNAESALGGTGFTRSSTAYVDDVASSALGETTGFGGNIYWNFRRAPSFFDEVCYTGTGVARTVNHNLGAVPELVIVKKRSLTDDWPMYVASQGATKYIKLDSVNASNTGTYWNNTAPTSTVFSLGALTGVNNSGDTFVAYLFATCAGVSKVGTYTGTGTTLQVNCGFSAGARFVLIKRTDSTGDWYVWDTARGIVSGNDPYVRLNSASGEVTTTDYIDTYSAGFELSSTAPAALNASGGTYIFLAIA